MIPIAIIVTSFSLQCAAAIAAFRLIGLTGSTCAWLLLSLGIATMAIRRFITLVMAFTDPTAHAFAFLYSYELIGLLGSLAMLLGVLAIKPVFLRIQHAEQEQRALSERLQEALHNIRVLNGLLPICANCKKIRDDRGYWQQIETYISTRTDTTFSHGICPDCMKKLYPEFSDSTK
jgi:hypothetical protein